MSQGPKPYAPPMKDPLGVRLFRLYARIERGLVGYFAGRAPTFRNAFFPFLLLTVVLYIRHPFTNYIFDEQEALLANPYVNGLKDLGYWDAIHRDFWGLPPDGSIGSYRPLPNLIWRATWVIAKHPFFHHLYNLLFHALNGALLGAFAFALTRRHAVGWFSGAVFITAAVATEAVSGIVGIADVLGGLGAILALSALRLGATWMPIAVFGAMVLGLFSKESALVCVPLIPAAALLTAPNLHPQRPARWMRTLLALAATVGAFVLYVELRREWFPSPLASDLQDPLPAGASLIQVLHHDFLVWFRQAPLPQDPLNNPLAEADFPHRVAGALRVYWRGFTQVLWPTPLSGDYSFPQEPIPEDLYAWETVAGGLMMVGPLLLGLGLMIYSWIRELIDKRRLVAPGPLGDALTEVMASRPPRLGAPLVMAARRPWHRRRLEVGLCIVVAAIAALGTEIYFVKTGGPSWVRTWPYAAALLCVGIGVCIDGWRGQKRPMTAPGPWPWRHIVPMIVALGGVWMVVSYFPHSNIPAVLPTVRAERFWYFPVIGTSLILGVVLAAVWQRFRQTRVLTMSVGALIPTVFLGLQMMFAYLHSMDYENDLAFWRATKNAVPFSAKAHLNYSVMVGARGDLDTRLFESKVAMTLAPEWPMAAIYTGDTLCRMDRADEAWPYYRQGFSIGAGERSLIALALQCMHDEKILDLHEEELRALADEHEGSWLAYLAHDTLNNHEKYNGVDPQYRPRGYNEAVKDEVETRFGERADSENRKVTEDTVLSSAHKTTNFVNVESLILKSTEAEITKALIRFDLSVIPEGATITSVVLYMNTTDEDDAGAEEPVDVYEPKEAWTAAQANWVERIAGTNWSAPGIGPASYEPVQLASVVMASPSGEYPIDLPVSVVQGWVSSPERNYGLVLESAGSVIFHSSESATVEKRPVLALRYNKP